MAYYWVLTYKWIESKNAFVLFEKTPIPPDQSYVMYLYAVEEGITSTSPEQEAIATALAAVDYFAERLGGKENCKKIKLKGLSNMIIARAYLCEKEGEKHLLIAAMAPYPPYTIKLPSEAGK